MEYIYKFQISSVVLGIDFSFQDQSLVWNFDQLIRSDLFLGVTK